jgi:GH35 family endo-1,4-beta-xylanase
MKFLRNSRLCLWVFSIAIFIGLLQSALFSPFAKPQTLIEPTINQLEASIRKIRMGDLQIRVIDKKQNPIADAEVRIEQMSHAFQFGTSLRTEMFRDDADKVAQTKYLQIAKELANSSVHEDALKWYSTEPIRGQVSYAEADRILAWSDHNYPLPMRGHNLFWEVERWSQKWLQQLSNDDLRQAVQQRATEICTRYRGRITEYDVLNEMLHGNFFRSRLGDRIVDDMFIWCAKADPQARLYLNEYDILNGKLVDAYAEQIRLLLARGIPVGGIGIQAHIRENISVAQMQSSIDTLAQLGLPIKITEVSVLADTEERKSQILTDLYRVAFANPAVKGITLWGFWEGAAWEPKTALYDRQFKPLPSAIAYRKLLLEHWRTNKNGKTGNVGDLTGIYSTRTFFGQYRVTVNSGKFKIQQMITFDEQTHSQNSPYTIQLPI